jgi:hypothetical protein
MEYDVYVEARNISDVSKLEELLACRRVNININAAIAFHVGTTISN